MKSSNISMLDGFVLPRLYGKYSNLQFYRMNPTVERLQVHIPNRQQVRFYKHQNINI